MTPAASSGAGTPVLALFFALLAALALLMLLARRASARRGVFAALGGALVVLADQAVKAVVVRQLALGETAALLPPLLGLRHVQNFGAAWSSFSGARWLLIGVTAVGLGALGYLLRRIVRHPLGVWSLSLVTAGGVGNLIDRVRLGYVVDMLEFLFVDFPIFNVADVFVTCGTLAAAVYYLKYYEAADAKRWQEGRHGDENPDG